MNKRQEAAGLLVSLSLLFSAPAFAQATNDGIGKIVPVELFVCSYRDGQDEGDLNRVIARWSKFMDDNGVNNYAAWTLSPYFYGADQNFDFIWMGASADGNAMGAGIDLWLSKGGELQGQFNAVADCNTHVLLSSAMYKAPPDGETPSSAVISMTDCKINEGRSYREVRMADVKWAEYLTNQGSKMGYFHWFPVFGGGNADFDYKVVSAQQNFTDLGADFEHFANGGGRAVARDIFANVDTCDDARVYLATPRRTAQLR